MTSRFARKRSSFFGEVVVAGIGLGLGLVELSDANAQETERLRTKHISVESNHTSCDSGLKSHAPSSHHDSATHELAMENESDGSCCVPSIRAEPDQHRDSIEPAERRIVRQDSAPTLDILGGNPTTYLTRTVVKVVFQHISGKGTFFCTGTIVSSSHILTAAHCLPRAGKQSIAVHTKGDRIGKKLNVVAEVYPGYKGKFQKKRRNYTPGKGPRSAEDQKCFK